MTKILTDKCISFAKELINVALEDFETARLLYCMGQFHWGLITLQQQLE
jgi:HEPN domain-containing protein